jgi:hypothetical protein
MRISKSPVREQDNLRNSVFVSLVVVGMVAFVTHGFVMAKFPGLQYDELLFVNAATNGGIGLPADHFVKARVLGVPVLLMDYIGALKAWLFAPLFSIFGISKITVRVPMVLISALSIGVSTHLVKRFAGNGAALFTFALLTSEPAYSLMARNDWGPVAIAGLLRVTTLGGLLLYLETGRARFLIVLIGALNLGVFNKLDFVVFSAPLVIAGLLLFRRRWVSLWGTQRLLLGLSIAVSVHLHGIFYFYMYRPASASTSALQSSIGDRFFDRVSLLRSTFGGSSLSSYMTGSGLSRTSWMLPLSLIASIVGVLCMNWREKGTGQRSVELERFRIEKEAFFILICFLSIGIVLAMVFLEDVSGPHHAATIWPFPIMAMCVTLPICWSMRPRRPLLKSIGLVLVTVCVLGALFSQISTKIQMDTRLSDTELRSSIWSDEVEVAARAIVARSISTERAPTIVATDWGLGNQIAALSSQHRQVEVMDLWPAFTTIRGFNDAVGQLRLRAVDGLYLVSHTQVSEIFPDTSARTHQLVGICVEAGGSLSNVFLGRQVQVVQLKC